MTSCGPGGTPWMSSAAISTAVTGPVGRPSASIGTKAPVEAALLANSGPATPADRALAELFRMLGDPLLQRIGQKLEMICAEPGTMPTRKPSTVPRAIGIADSRHSVRGRQQLGAAAARATLAVTLRLGVERISPSPNRPTATGTMPMPSPSSGMSKA